MRLGALALADGTVFHGVSVGADGVATGEVVFNTSSTGYQEIATDPSYAGQVVVMTTPHVGNYGVTALDAQADAPACSGFVVRSMSRTYSNWRAEGSFAHYLTESGVVALSEIDTRRLTRHIRDRGAMPAAIGSGLSESELVERASTAPSMEGRDLTQAVTTRERWHARPTAEHRGRIVAIDFGVKRAIIDRLTALGLAVDVLPASASADEVMALAPAGIFLSNGPGDPEPVTTATGVVRTLLGKVPIFGICLGHQILALALGARSFKLPFGHHGGNHPVLRLADGTVDMTAQNHGFGVDLWSMSGQSPPALEGLVGPELLPARVDTPYGEVVPTHQNLNDGTLEGLACRDVAAFSVQYHPEAAPGPNDAVALFERFADLIGADS